jgi:hypothetical protein
MKKACQNCQQTKEQQERKSLAKWISKEITSREYTETEVKAMLHFSKTGQKEKI